MPNCRWYESESKTRTELTGYLKPNRWFGNFLTITTLLSTSNMFLGTLQNGRQWNSGEKNGKQMSKVLFSLRKK